MRTAWAAFAAGIALAAGCRTPQGQPRETGGVAALANPALYVLGRAQDGGLPHLGCERESCCAAARRSGRRETPACLGLHDGRHGKLYLFEATPAIEQQVALLHELGSIEGRGRAPVDGLFVTHAHLGHYLGLAWLGREVAASQRTPLFVTPRFAQWLRDNGPWSQLVDLEQVELRATEPGGAVELTADLVVESLAVPHRDEFSDTVAFRIRGPRRTVLFCPDVDAWTRHAGLLDRLLEGVDVAYLDATFYDGRELPDRIRAEIPHPPMLDTMDRLAARAAAKPGTIRFLHFNHTNPAWNDPGVADSVRARGFGIAEVGERVDL
jgi:pyrroloquinoline quinone biosynthesis protein B